MTTQIKSLFDRWVDLEDQREALSEDLRELFIEAKKQNFEPKALRAAFRYRHADADKRAELDATMSQFKVYLLELANAIEPPLARPAPARVEKIGEFRPAVVKSTETYTAASGASDDGEDIPDYLRRRA